MPYFAPSNQLNGILNYLSYDSSLFKELVTANGTEPFYKNTWGDWKKVLDLKSDKSQASNCWCSIGEANPYIDIIFKKHKILIEAFNIKTQSLSNTYYITNFSLFGSKDNSPWKKIYTHNSQKLSAFTTYSFRCQNRGIFDKFRFQMTQKTSNPDSWNFIIGAVEFFGSLGIRFPYSQNNRIMHVLSISLLMLICLISS